MSKDRDELVTLVARAIYDAEDSQSGDSVGTVIWSSDHLFFDEVPGEKMTDTAWRASGPVCRDAARAAIAAVFDWLEKPSDVAEDEGWAEIVLERAPEDVFRVMLAQMRREALGDNR